MKKLITLFSLCICSLLFANNDKYRLIINDDPASTITIAWNQSSGANPTVHYGTTDFGTTHTSYPFSQTPDRSVTDKNMSNQFVRLTGLTPNTDYFFVINDSQGNSDRFWFRTAPDDLSRLSFIAGGDSRNNRTPRQNANRLVSKLKPHAVLFGGDMTNSNTDQEWNDWFDDWQLTTSSDGRMIPIIAARGNHESNTVIYNLFDTPTVDSYYAVTFGDDLIRAYTLNSEISVTGNQLTWLTGDLAANPDAIWKTAQYHKPMRPHTSAKSEGDDIYNAWAQLFYDENVRLVVDCDSHTVKTTWPLVPSSGPGNDMGFIRDDENGTVYAGEGCWGAPTRSNDDDKSWTRDSGSFNQFKLVFVSTDRIELRTIQVDNAQSVGEVSNNDPFTLPNNLDVWNASNGSVVTIYPKGESPRLTFKDGTLKNYGNGTNINLPVTITDESAGVTQVEFYVNNSLVFTDDTAPYAFTNNYTNGKHSVEAIATDFNGKTGSTQMDILVGTLTGNNNIKIATDNDDVEEETTGNVYFNSSDLEMIYDSGTTERNNQKIGLLFQNVDIPFGAVITSSYIQFTADRSDNSNTNLQIYGEDVGNASSFDNSAGNTVSDRNRVSGSVPWSPAAWTNDQAGVNERTPDISTLLQQIVNRCDWQDGNNAVFMVEGSGTNFRRADSYNTSSGNNAARLVYTWSYDAGLRNDDLEIAIDDTVDTNYASPTNVTITANAQKVGAGINNVQFFVDGALVKTDTSVPYNYTNTFGNGSHLIEAIATDGCNQSTDHISINVGNFTTSEATRIAEGDDDVEETQSGRVYFNSSDLELVYDSQAIFDGVANGYQKVGLRFQKINIPRGATLTDAYVQFRSDNNEGNSNAAEYLIYAEDEGNSVPYQDDIKYNVTARNKVAGSVYWSPNAWPNAETVSADQRTPNLSGLLQQVVNRCDWIQGNAMQLSIEGTGVSLTNTDAKRVGDSFEGSASAPPTLHYTYSYDATLPEPTLAEFNGSWKNTILPNSNSYVTIRSNYDTSANGGSIEACEIFVAKGATLRVAAGDYLNIGSTITVEGNLIVEHEGIVVQTEVDAQVVNNGTISVEITTPVLDNRDFMIMGSPMTQDSRNGVFHDAFLVLNNEPNNFMPHPGVPTGGTNFADDKLNNGKFLDKYYAGINPAEGYIVRPQTSYVDPAGIAYNMTYSQGTLNNGDITQTLVFNGLGDNPSGTPHLLANPYASPISAVDLINDNALINEVYFWEHLTPPSPNLPGSNGMNFDMDDISMFNGSMGIPAVNDVMNAHVPNGVISTGQGFAIKAQAAGDVTFTNSMRLTSGNTTLRNASEENEIDRLLIEVRNTEYGVGGYTGIAFNPQATEGLDVNLDTERLATTVSLYSHLQDGSEQLGIQTMPAFENGMKIPVGFTTQVTADIEYVISMASRQGNQVEHATVYLIDNVLGTVTNLNTTDYTFKSNKSTYDGRFTIQFESEVLGVNDVLLNAIAMYPNPASNWVTISSPKVLVESAIIYSVQGRMMQQVSFGNQSSLTIDIASLPTGMYLVEIQTEKGKITKQLLRK